ncbi:hypothetical protein NOVO_08370 [Rickettsiales bacterium Ac37b]|nr:hypothetical protein NOVO_08370 [Rickettsiales bacterium Ac37b]
MKKELHKFVDQLRNASPERRKEIMTDLYNQANPTEKSLFAKISDSIIQTSHAFGPATPAVLAVSYCLSNPVCSALLVGTAITVYHAILTEVNKGNIIYTPEHKNEGSILSTPIHQEEGKILSTPMPEAEGIKILHTPIPTSKQSVDQGFEIPDSDVDMSILYKIKIDNNGKIDFTDFDIKNHEGQAHKGHTEYKHIGRDIDYLSGRFAEHKQKTGKDLTGSTTYPDYETANKVVKGILEQNEKAFVDWIKNAAVGKSQEFIGSFTENIGEGLKPGETRLTPRNKAVVRILKTQDGPKIITSFPVE